MPHYVFLCQDCHQEFTEVLHITHLPKYQGKCPKCGSKNVLQLVG